MIFAAALLASGVLAGLGLLHFFWALRGPGGFGATVPEAHGKPIFVPGPLATALVGIALVAAAAIVLGRVGMWGATLPRWIFQLGTGGLAGMFLLRAIGEFRYVGLFKRVRGTRFATWDERLFTPLCLALATLLFAVAGS